MTNDYRTTILQRLKEQNKPSEQFQRVFSSYKTLFESFHHLFLKTNNSQKQFLNSDNYDLEIDTIKNELENLYKKKATNDQQLIDANLRIKELQQNIADLINKRDSTLQCIKKIDIEIDEIKIKINKSEEENITLKNELSASKILYQKISEKYIKTNQECTDLIEKIKTMKFQEVQILNEFNDRDEKRRLEKIRTKIEEATNSKLLTTLLDDGSSGGSDDNSLELLGEIIPERCRFRIEVSEMGEINDCLFHSNGHAFFTAGNDKRVTMYDLIGEFYSKTAVFEGANQALTRIDLNLDGKLLAASSCDKTIRVWSVDNRRLRLTFTGHTDKVVSAKFFNQGRLIASGSNDRCIKIFDITNNRCTQTFFPGSMVLDVATTDHFGSSVISSHYDKSVRFWDLRSDVPSNSFKLNGKVASLFLSPDNQSILCSCRDETLSLVDIRSNNVIHIYSAEQYRTASDYCKCVMSPNGTFVAAGSADGNIFIWNSLTTRLEKVLYKNAHDNSPILSLAWHPRGHMMLSGDKKKMLCLWK